MRILLVDNDTIYIEKLLHLLQGHQVTIVKLHEVQAYKKECDLIILSGGHSYSVVYEGKHYKNEIKLLKHNRTPTLGICLGAELIAHTFGAHLKLQDKQIKKVVKINILRHDPIFEGIEEMHVFENHKWIIDRLSDELFGLACSTNGYEVIKHKTAPMYGVQFHPEFLAQRTNGKDIFNNFLNLV